MWLSANTAYALNDSPPNIASCQPAAVATDDNDMRLSDDDRPPGKSVPIPPAVVRRLRIAAAQFLAKVPPGTADGMTCKDIFPDVFMIAEPQRRELFVAEISLGMGGDFFYLVLHDLDTNAVTGRPPRIGARSMQSFGIKDSLMKKPLLSTADLFQNHHPQIVFEERVHNGTMYNAVVYHYFDIQPDLAMTRVLALETRVLALDPRQGIFVREIKQLSPTRIRMDTFADANGKRRAQGYVILESAGRGKPFHVVERHPIDPRDDKSLVTFTAQSPKADDDFLRESYTFYY